jgi:hypothetical protein
MAPILEGKINWLGPKTLLKGELLIWRIENQTKDQSIVQLKDSICFKLVQIVWQQFQVCGMGISLYIYIYIYIYNFIYLFISIFFCNGLCIFKI